MRRAGLFSEEFGDGDFERVGDEQEVAEPGVTVAALVPVDRLVVAADKFTKRGLREVGMETCGADVLADCPAAGVYPDGHRVEWHSNKL